MLACQLSEQVVVRSGLGAGAVRRAAAITADARATQTG